MDFMGCQRECQNNKECHFWTFRPKREKNKRRRRKINRSEFIAIIAIIPLCFIGSLTTANRITSKKKKKLTGGTCYLKNKLALCGRRRAREKGVVSGPKECTAKWVAKDLV